MMMMSDSIAPDEFKVDHVFALEEDVLDENLDLVQEFRKCISSVAKHWAGRDLAAIDLFQPHQGNQWLRHLHIGKFPPQMKNNETKHGVVLHWVEIKN